MPNIESMISAQEISVHQPCQLEARFGFLSQKSRGEIFVPLSFQLY